MSHWGGVGTLFGGGALHAREINAGKNRGQSKSRRTSSATMHGRPSERQLDAIPRGKENVPCTSGMQKVVSVPSIRPVLLDPFSISLGCTQLERLSQRNSCEETARHATQDYTHTTLHVEEVLSIVRSELKSRGAYEIAGVRSKFRRADKDGSETLSFSEFQHLLTDQLDIHLTDKNCTELFHAFDKNASGHIDYKEFLLQVRGEMNSRRKTVLHWVFDCIDNDKSGVIDMNDLLDTYNADAHPDVRAKKIKPLEALKRFIKMFDIGGVPDGKVTRKEFEDYYASLSAGIDSDEEFEDHIKSAWSQSSLMTGKSLIATWESIKKPSEVPSSKSTDAMKTAHKIAGGRTTGKGNSLHCSTKEVARHLPQDFSDTKLGTEELLKMVRNELKSRGAYEIAGIRSKFRRADKDGSQTLSFSEFVHLLKDQLDIHLPEEKQADLFHAFDANRCGAIDYQEFLLQVRGDMNTYRKTVMNQIFDFMDKDKSGVIDTNEFLDSYNADAHPDVQTKKIKPLEALKRFIKMFDIGGVPDGKVSRKEFEDYYASLSAGIDSDEEFEQIIKSAWTSSPI